MARPLLLKTWRYRIFAVTWLSYAGFYICRKNFSVVMPILTDEFGFTKTDLALILTGYSLIYMLGQIVNGLLCDRFGAADHRRRRPSGICFVKHRNGLRGLSVVVHGNDVE